MAIHAQRAATVLTAFAVVGVAGCGGSHSAAGGGSRGPREAAGNVIVRAERLTQRQSGEKVRGDNVTTTGSGTTSSVMVAEVSRKPPWSRMRFTFSSASGGRLDASAVITRSAFYMKFPRSLTSRLPGRRPWLVLPFADASQYVHYPKLAFIAVFATLARAPGQALSLLQAATDVTRIGTKIISGVTTNEYRTVVALNDLVSDAAPDQRAAARLLVRHWERQVGGTALPETVYIDRLGRIREVSFTTHGEDPDNGRPATITVVTQVLAFGRQAPLTIPPASQTTNFARLLPRVRT
jgi:hypothetical protein